MARVFLLLYFLLFITVLISKLTRIETVNKASLIASSLFIAVLLMAVIFLINFLWIIQ